MEYPPWLSGRDFHVDTVGAPFGAGVYGYCRCHFGVYHIYRRAGEEPVSGGENKDSPAVGVRCCHCLDLDGAVSVSYTHLDNGGYYCSGGSAGIYCLDVYKGKIGKIPCFPVFSLYIACLFYCSGLFPAHPFRVSVAIPETFLVWLIRVTLKVWPS